MGPLNDRLSDGDNVMNTLLSRVMSAIITRYDELCNMTMTMVIVSRDSTALKRYGRLWRERSLWLRLLSLLTFVCVGGWDHIFGEVGSRRKSL